MPSSVKNTKEITEFALIPPIPTPHWGVQTGSAFTIRATNTINATPKLVLETLLDTNNYSKWNHFVPRVTFPMKPPYENNVSDGLLREGVTFTEHVDMFGNGRSSGIVRMRLLVTAMSETEEGGRLISRVVWLGKGYPDWALRSERVHEISLGANGLVVYDVWETFSGPLSGLVRLFVGKALVKRFRQWNKELKGYVEGLPRA